MIGWHWHQLDHMQVICTSLQTDNHASTSSLQFFIGQMLFPPPNQQHQNTKDKNILQSPAENVAGLMRCVLMS